MLVTSLWDGEFHVPQIQRMHVGDLQLPTSKRLRLQSPASVFNRIRSGKRSHSDCWNITIFYRKYIFKKGPFSIVMLDYRSVNLHKAVPKMPVAIVAYQNGKPTHLMRQLEGSMYVLHPPRKLTCPLERD